MSDQETTKNFVEVMSKFEWPEPKSVFYRLYYNDDGSPKCYSMEDLPGKYIDIDLDTYRLRPWNVQVVDNKLRIINPAVTVQKLIKCSNQGIPCDPRDVTVVVDHNQTHIKWMQTNNEID